MDDIEQMHNNVHLVFFLISIGDVTETESSMWVPGVGEEDGESVLNDDRVPVWDNREF